MLNKSWMSEEEIGSHLEDASVEECLTLLRKGNLVEEQWRMPEPGQKPVKEFKTNYSKFRANFQCNMMDLGDLLYIAISTEESLRNTLEEIEEEILSGNTSINDISRKFGVSPVFVKGLAKRIPYLDIKGQGMVLIEKNE